MARVIGSRIDEAAMDASAAGHAGRTETDGAGVAGRSPAVSWPAIVAGATVAGGATLILGTLGGGLGFGSPSPWTAAGSTAAGLTSAAAVWLVVTQWVSSGLGGYVAGRLRGRWHGTHVHETFFRDTAHGLIMWALSTLLMGVAASSLLRMTAGTSVAALEAGAADLGYATDRLFRPALSTVIAGPGAPLVTAAADQRRDEAQKIVAHAAAAGSVSDADRDYLAGLVAGATGASPAEAERRAVDLFSTVFDAREAAAARAEKIRRGAAEASVLLSLSLLLGAFIACVTAAIGGRLRDEHV